MEKLDEVRHPEPLPDWSGALALQDSRTLLHEAFEAQAVRTPEALAVVGEDARLTYRELNERANRLAAQLRTLGVGPEVRVGVCLERTAGMVVGLLATLKAGGAYVPLDPAYPQERLGFMLHDAGAGVLLTRSDLAGRCGPFAGVTVQVDQTDRTDLTDRSDLPSMALSGNLAYLIYTSGSTGRPKGVAIEHRSAVGLLRWAADVFSPDDLAGVLAATSICFDLSVFEIFVPLALGGTVVVASNALDLPRLGPPITLINTVPSAMAELVRSRRVPTSVRVVNLAGEALPGSLVEEIYGTTSVERVYNLYGPSEDTTYSTEALISRADQGTAPPIGDPLPGTQAWLLDPEGTPVPFGEVGELHLSGEGLARGYLGRPELTAERFLPDPFSGEAGARMYRTGDLARLLSDGQLHYLGRADQQVKIRGFRVELGEVEDALARHPAVREAAVAVREVAGGKLLAAYLVTGGSLPEIGELRSFLARTLPHYMIPSQFQRVDALPRTLNGKLDRKALAALPERAELSEGVLPLSFAQQRIWLAERERPGQPTYNEPAAWNLAGPVDRSALAAALSALVERHAVLRTRYVEVGNAPFQQVVDPVPVEVPLVDLTALPEAAREDELERGVRDEVRRLFSLGGVPLLRATLFRRGDDEHTLSVVVHHIAYDGRSKEVLARDLAALYAAARAGLPAPLPALPLQYGDFARLQREAWQGVPPARLAEWRGLLADAAPLELPPDRLAEPTSRGTTVWLELPPELTATLRGLARAEGASLFQALLAVFAALLGRWSDRRDGVLGTTAAGRSRPETLPLIGFFVNLLPLRLDLTGNPGLRALLARVRPVVRAAAEAQEDLPYAQLVAALREGRAGAPFRTLFQLHPPLAVPALEGLAVSHRPVDTGTAKFDLEGTLLESGDGLLGYFQASADLYEPATIARLADRFRKLLTAAVADPEIPLDDVPLFSAAEMEEIVARRLAAAGREEAVPESGAAGEAETTRLLARIWCDILGLPSVGPRDDFFQLGGHSLLGAAMLSRVRDLFGVDLPLQRLFRTPTVVGLAGAIADALRGGGRPMPVLAKTRRAGRLPLSFAQERFWFLERLEAASAVYNVPLALRLDGRLDSAALDAALREVVRRHEALRTRFDVASGAPFQEITPAVPALPRIDLAALPEDIRHEELARIARAEAAARFDLGQALLLRARLVRLGAEEHALLMTVHHAVFDGASQAILNRELSALYTAALEGRPSPLPEPPLQYADFAVWQRSWLTQDVLDGLLAWWRDELAGALPVLELPLDRPRPAIQAFRGAVERIEIPGDLADGVAALARRAGATRFMLLLAAFQALLQRVTGQEDALVGSPASNRPHGALAETIGLFVETLVLRGRTGGDPPFSGLLARVRETALGAFAHQDLPFERLVAGLQVERSAARNPLVQVLFTLQDALEEGLALPGLSTHPLDAGTAAAKFDLSLFVETAGGGLRASLEYDADLFASETARRLLGGYLALLSAVVSNPAARLSDLPVLPEAERRELLARTEAARRAAAVAPARRLGGGAVAVELVSRLWAEVLGLDRVAPQDNFFHLGGHSLLGGRVLARIRDLFGVDLPLRTLFLAPTAEGLAAAIADAICGGGQQALPPVERIPRDGRLPQSFAQERFRFLEEVGASSSIYNVPSALRLDGRLDPEALAAGLREIVRRHEALRTRLVEAAGATVQEIAPADGPEVMRIDLSHLPEKERQAELDRRLRAAADEPFDLARTPLLRVTLFRLGAEAHVLLLCAHHAAFDGWSQRVLHEELSALYAAAVEGRPSPLPELPVQYADFAVWQRRWMSEEVLDGLLDWWSRELQGAPQVLELPADRPRPQVRTHRGTVVRAAVPAALAEAVTELGRREGATRFMVLCAVFQTLIGRLSGEDDLLLGVPVSNRSRPELEGLIGLFVDTLVLRGRLTGDPTFRVLLGRVRETALRAFAHQGLPFDRLVSGLRVERSPARNPLVQVMFSLQDALSEGLSLPEIDLRPIDLDAVTAKNDLSLIVEESGGELRVIVEAAADLFERKTARRLLERFLALLAGAVADPAQRLSDLPLLAPAERHQLLTEWNDTALAVPAAPGLVQRIAERARRTPDALAVAEGERRLTYGALDLAAGRLARRLVRLGVVPESRVAVCLPRSIEGVISLLAVWKAGGAYVPLDPAHPADRLATVLEDSAARLLIARDLVLPGIQILDPEAGDGEEPLAETTPVEPNALAYVIYTSGSTGRPKGVEIAHDSLLHLVDWYVSFFRTTEADRKSLLARVGFDASVWEVWPTLSAGASLWVADEEVIAHPEALRGWMVEQGITVSFVPTPLAELLLAVAWPDRPALRVLQAAGDRLRHRPPADLPFALMNLYGPTEATICSTAQGPVPAHGEGLPTIGRPIGNVQAHVLDAAWQPVPAGVPGELCIGGAGVGRGYLGAPALTAERYVPDPFAEAPGRRLYRTGDLVRLRPDGEIEFLGRVDRQVKLRGFRVELGEIEAALARHPAVREAAAVLGDQRLVAFMTPRRAPLPPDSELAAFLRRSLPDYMVPSLFVTLEAMPLSANGKLDRRALAEKLEALPAGRGAAPGATLRTPAEELIAQVWCEVLHVAAVGPNDDFFQLGGHSLTATSVISRVRDLFGVEMPVRDLFQAPTVRGLARRVAAQLGEDPAPAPFLSATPADLQPVSFSQEALWFIDRLEQETAVYNMPVAWRLRGPVAAAALAASLTAVVHRHAVLRTRFVEVEGQPFQMIEPAGPIPLPQADLSALPPEAREAELARIGAAEAARGFDLGRGPLLRALLIVLAPHDHALVLILHHMVWDGWSTGILGRELAALYAAASTGSPSPLPGLPLQYADYAAWQRGWLRGTVLERLLAWWRRALKGAPQVLELPTDRRRPPVQTFRGAWEHLEVPADVAGEILALGRRGGATAFMTLLAAFQTLLHRLTGQDDLLVGSPAANRPRRELEALIGYFVETVVLRSRFHGGETFAGLLTRVRDACLGSMAHQELPFEKLVAELQAERDLSRNPLFQVMFSSDAPMAPPALPGVAVESLSLALPVSKFEMSLTSSLPERGEGLRLTLEYNLDLFDRSTARSFLERFAALLAAVTADPARRLDALPLITEAEAGTLLAAAAATAGPPVAPRRLHDLFMEQAARTPHELAVLTAAGERLTYADLDRRSRALAHFLRRHGVEAEVPVGVCLDRSPELIIALLGVLRAGGVYLPLDPAYPAERLSFMLGDAGAGVLITRHDLAGRCEPFAGLRVQLDRTDPADPANPSDLPPIALPGSLAYLIYTSGSTGRPKGVGVPHAVAAAHLETMARLFALDAGDRLLQFSSPSFDMSLEELLPPLFRGAAVVLRDADLWQPAELLGHLTDLGVTVLNLPTAYWHQWVADLGQPPAASSLRLVILGGEAMSGEAARTWLRSPLAGLTLLNSYGPTEGVITSTVLAVDAAAASAAVVPIGRALAGRSAWVLDWFGHPVPAGVPGELCLGGPMLARGYLGRPDLTAERFVPDPFSAAPGARLYRTGDRVSRRPDGILDFLGRVDRQLKIRGFRVEPGEIEAALAQHPAVREGVIDARPDTGGGLRLVAWVVPAASLEVPDLLQFLRDRLPEHMVPSALVAMEALPLTPNGKLDRRALPAPEIPAAGEVAEERPRTPVEEQLAGLWQELLGQPRIGLRESFFALGGHSLLALRLLARVRDTFGVSLPIRELFAAPTVEDLAVLVDEARQTGPEILPEHCAPPPAPALGADLLHRAFAAQAARTPTAVALVAGGERLTYDELHRRASRLARHLRAHLPASAGPEVLVGVCLERSADLIVALLAVLEAGCAYVPLDPAYPAERIAYMLEDSRACLLVSRRSLAASLPATAARVVCLDEDAAAIAARDASDPEVPQLPGSLAYLIYTSGSTGRAKGVAIEHASAVALVRWARQVFSREDLAGVLASTSVCFDLSVFEIFVPLALGGTVLLAENVLALPEVAAAAEVTLVNTVPSAMAQLVRLGEVPASVRVVNLAGEALSGRLADDIFRSTPVRRLLNLYGPSEDTTYSTLADIDPREKEAPAIGRPIAGTRASVVDPQGGLAPAGALGELYLGGEGLARGYFDRPGLTAERFVPDPWSGAPGARLYRTGDLVRWRPDGQLAFHGRADHQVKIRGFRIEPGEIEEALARHPAVREAAVVVGEDAGGRCLVACVAGDDPMPEPAVLREHLRQSLPEHMVPAVFLVLHALPRTPNGKVDRRELAQRARAQAAPSAAPAAEIVQVPLPPIRPVPRGGLLPVSFPQQRLWFVERLTPGSSAYNIPLGFRLRGPLDPSALAAALGALVRRHEVLRTRFVERDGQPWQEILPARPVTLPATDLSALSGERREAELARIGREEAARPFDLSAAPLRVRLVRLGRLGRLGPLDHALFLTVHHIATDGWSEEILCRELSALYAGSALPELPVQYADFAAWQRSWPERVMDAQRAYWSVRLAGLRPLELPTDRPRPPLQTFAGGIVEIAVPPHTAGALRALCGEHRVTLFMLLLAAWQTLLHRIADTADVAVGTPVANRTRPEIEGVVGFFVNVLTLRAGFAAGPSFAELLEQVRGSSMEAYDHVDVPFEWLVDELRVERDLSRPPLFQVLFVLQNAAPPLLAFPGLQVELLEPAATPAKFDLTLDLTDRGEAGFLGGIGYNRDLFDRTTAQRFAGHLANLLQAVASRPEVPAGAIDLLSAAERHQVLEEWNDRLLPGERLYVLDAGGMPCPPGVPGDLHRGGTGPGFRTGERARFLAAGRLEPVERRALPPPVRPAAAGFVAPRTPTEEALASLWCEILRVERVGRHDHFFDLGGHSLLATQLVARLRETLAAAVPLRTVFQTPVLADLAAVLDHGFAPVAAVRRVAAPRTLPPIRPVPRTGLLPVSFPQQRLWFVDRLTPDSATYNISSAFRLRGPLDPAALDGAFGALVRRHETLRTRFVERDGQPWQEILPASHAFLLPRVDLGGLPEAAREAELARLWMEESRQPFVLSVLPARAWLARLGAADHALFVTLHHIVSDGWSEEVLRAELGALYAAAVEGRPSPLPELPVQYADFAVWQRAWPEEVLDGQLAYWTGQLNGLSTLEVPTDRPRPPLQTFHGSFEMLAVSPRTARSLRALAGESRATLFMVLFAAWQTLFHRITGQADVAQGTPVANRNQPGIEGLIGFFVNLLALRTDLSGDPSFLEVVRRVRRVALEAYDHTDVPFERLIDELDLERDLSRQPLVQVMFVLQNAGAVTLRLPGLAVEELPYGGTIAKFDLTLSLVDEGDGFLGGIEYNTDLFDRSTVLRLAGQLVHVLDAVAGRPLAPVSGIELLTAAERHQVLEEWNDTAAPFPAEVLIHQWFEAQVDRAPGAVAAVWRGLSITYGELEARANRIAALLRGLGGLDAGRGRPVGVWMERSLDMIAGVLGVLKAGGHYLPLDPSWPAERVETILAASEVPAVLTRSAHLPPLLELRWRVPSLTDLICLDVEEPAPPAEEVDAGAVRAVFDLVAERALDRATAGGFVSSFTGEPFSEAEVDEYRDRVLALAEPWLGPEKRVLEIGSGSGLILWDVAPRVARCVGLDPSPLTQERNRAEAERRGLGHVELPVGFAHEIESWPGGSFDLVLLASTVQFFPGPLYLERIVAQALRLLAPGGAVVLADVPDARRQEELQREIEEHRARRGLPPRHDSSKILRLDEDLFRDLAEATILHRETGFDNELRFRYDVVLTGGPGGEGRRKRLWTSWHVERASAGRLPAVAAPDDLAYVIHTSGSTGQPKGIMVQHRPVANLIHWINNALGVGPGDRVLFVTSLCFDLSVWDVFGLLAAGGSIHVAAEEDLRDPEALVRTLLAEGITIWDSAPAALVRLAPLFPAEPAAGSRLRRVMLSGDWIPVTLPDRVRAAFPRAEVTSLGGATEATVWSNSYPVGEVDPAWPSIPYGRPMPNAQYHVLDAGLLPCPAGVPGDLYIGGDCLCVGYAHEPALTAAAFVPDSFAGAPGARLYRTGDRARWFTDGNLEFLGRVDQQVKIRGFRIELGEIEVSLVRHAGVREAVVLAREDVPGDQRLVAYVVPPAGEEAPGSADLRDFLRHALPDYMIPAAFVVLDHLPVTANGKLDRRALPAPAWERSGEEESAGPRTPTEETLAALWRQLLSVERVGLHDSFFDLGGHSLLATQLIARLRETFGLEVPLRVLFQAPALADLAAAIDRDLAAQAGAPATTAPVIPVVPRDGEEGELPLSASQLRQWFLVQLDPASAAYNIPVTLSLDGDLRPEVLAAVLRALAGRHEALLTTFDASAGRPFARVAPEAEVPLPAADLSALPEPARQAEARRLVGEELERPFDLARGPLVRALLLRLAPGEHILAVTVHHIVFDGFSLGIFLRELASLYEAFAAGLPSPLPALPIQYADYAAWQRGWMATPEFAARVERWKERLAGASRVLELPADRPRPPVQSHRGQLLEMTMPPGLAAGLKALTGREGVTLFMAVLAGYATLLSRATGQEDLNIGTFVANRRHEVLERLIGFFVNTLVLRADLTGDPTFRELLARTRSTTLEAFELQDVPFEQILDEMGIERDLSRTPLFQVMFGVQNFAVPTLHLPGLTLRSVGMTDMDRTPADLACWMWEEGGVLAGWLQLGTDLFETATVARMGTRLTTLLEAAVADPSRRLSELRLLPAAEERQILAWSAGGTHAAPPRLVHERMREQARRTPEAPAVISGGETLTYADLDRRAGRVARGLRRLGVGPETVVGLCLDRTPDLIVALYGILGAGAAYLPLDPALPADRLVLLTGDSGAPAVLTRSGLAAALPDLPARVLLVDADFAAEGNDGLVEDLAEPGSAAYVLYTSGSTGTPKGVVVEHRALASFVEAALEVYGIGPGDRVLQFANPAFDTSAEEIYPVLAVGGALVLRDEEMLASPARFLAAVEDAGVTVLDLPTAWWHEVSARVEEGLPVPPDLRLIILGGERALPERVRGWLAATGTSHVHLFNSYGPTEGTVVATACDLRETAPAVPIGRPLHGVEVRLLDAHLRPVPMDVPGEICLGGAHLARGYLGRPDLTAERFAPSPFGSGERLYRTGDLGRWRPDGQLDFAGRADDQVKIRGFRIEPGEVAAALTRHPAVQEAVVLAHEVRPGERELTAWAVPSRPPGPDPAELRAFLKESLPVYMLPAGIVLLEALPRTRTGKVDRKALPAPDRAVRHGRHDFAPPETATEELIAGIWQELLGLEQVGIYDNFFDLGGHSLLAPQVISRIEEVFQVELPLRILFAAPTVAQMAVALEEILLAQIEELSEEEAAGLVGD